MRIRWPWSRPKASARTLADPALAALLGVGWTNFSGVEVTEESALGISAVYRAVSLISGTLAGQRLRAVVDVDGLPRPVSSWLDNPAGYAYRQTPHEWKETVLLHLLLHGNAFLLHVYGGAGQLVGAQPIHPLCVSVEEATFFPGTRNRVAGGLLYRVSLLDGRHLEIDGRRLTHIPWMSLDGVRGLSPIGVARNSLGTAIAGDRAAAKLFNSGMLISGVASAEEDIDPDEAKVIREWLDRATSGWENNGRVPFINRKIKLSPWTMSAEDAQFLQSRAFSIEEVARWYGVPPHLLMQTEKVTSWGTGITEQNRGLGRFTLAPPANRIEERLGRMLAEPRHAEWDFSRLERPNPETEIGLIIDQINAKLLTVDEGRAMLGRPPLEGSNARQS